MHGLVALDKIDVFWKPAAGGHDQIVAPFFFDLEMAAVQGAGVAEMVASGARQQIAHPAVAVQQAVDGHIRRAKAFARLQVLGQGIAVQPAGPGHPADRQRVAASRNKPWLA